MKTLQTHLYNIQSSITVDKASLLHSLWLGDISLMDCAVTLSFTTFQLKCVNAIQLYHHVTFLSELFNVDGTHIVCKQWYTGEVDSYYSPNPLRLHQTKPNSKCYLIWQHLLHLYTVSANNRQLCSPFGSWQVQSHSLQGLWSKHYHTPSQLIYI